MAHKGDFTDCRECCQYGNNNKKIPTPFDPSLWHTVEGLRDCGISEKRLLQWRKPAKKGGQDLQPATGPNGGGPFHFWGGDIHACLLADRRPG